MIGNKIKFTHIDFDLPDIKTGKSYTVKELEGIVVDAFTNVTGSSKYESIFGFGEGKGSTDSRRMYKVETLSQYTNRKTYQDISAGSLIEILEFKAQTMEPEKFTYK